MTAIKNLPDVKPFSIADFAKSKMLPPEFTFTRASSGTSINEYGELETVGNNAPRFTNDITTHESLGVLVEQSSTNYAPPLTLWTKPNGITPAKDGDWYKCTAYVTGTASRSVTHVSGGLPNPTDTSGLFTLSIEISRDMTLGKRVLLLMGYNTYGNGYSGVNFDLATKTGSIQRSKTTALEPPMVIAYTCVDTNDGWRCTVTIRNDEPGVTSINNIQWGVYPGRVESSTDVGYQKYRHVQIEQLPYATSYIPTSTSAPVTRASEILAVGFNNKQRSFVFEFNQPLSDFGYGLFIKTDPEHNVMVVYSQKSPNLNIGETINWPNVVINEPYNGMRLRDGNKTNRLVFVCGEDSFRAYFNGKKVNFLNATKNNKPEFITSITFNYNNSCTTVFKRVNTYQRALTDDEACRLSQVV